MQSSYPTHPHRMLDGSSWRADRLKLTAYSNGLRVAELSMEDLMKILKDQILLQEVQRRGLVPPQQVGVSLKNVPDADLAAEIKLRCEAMDDFRDSRVNGCFSQAEPKVEQGPKTTAANTPKSASSPGGGSGGAPPAKSETRAEAERKAGEAVARMRRGGRRDLDIPFGGHWI